MSTSHNHQHQLEERLSRAAARWVSAKECIARMEDAPLAVLDPAQDWLIEAEDFLFRTAAELRDAIATQKACAKRYAD